MTGDVAACREAKAFAERATKWKERAKSGDKQVQKLHQALQNIAKLLQIQGRVLAWCCDWGHYNNWFVALTVWIRRSLLCYDCRATPSAVATIEKLLSDLVPQRRKRQGGSDRQDGGPGDADDQRARARTQEARQCYYCGKMFASADFLESHHLRRHPNEDKEIKLAAPRPPRSVERLASENGGTSVDHTSGEKAVQRMLQQAEHALQTHEESLRSLAKEEARKIESLYEQLHVESRLAEEIKASRILAEKQLKDAQDDLDAILQKRDEALADLDDMKEQIQFLDLKCKMEYPFENAMRTSPPRADQSDMATVLEIKRLEQALALVNSALSESRIELSRLQDVHSSTLKEKQALTDRLNEAQILVKRLESSSLQSGADSNTIRVSRSECAMQTDRVELKDASTHASVESTSPTEVRVASADAGTQTRDETQQATGIEMAVQTDPDEMQLDVVPPNAPHLEAPAKAEVALHRLLSIEIPSEDAPTQPPIAPAATREGGDGADTVSDYVFNIVVGNFMDAVASRAQRYECLHRIELMRATSSC